MSNPVATRFEIKMKANAPDKCCDVWMYGDIGGGFWSDGGVNAKTFGESLGAMGKLDTINCYVNSGGGDVFEGLAIYNILARNPATVNVYVDGLAASIASVICMAGDNITMASNAFMMIHDPWTMTMGDSESMREMADRLDAVKGQLVDTYATRTGMKADDVAQLMCDETWMNADDAVAKGFATGKTDGVAMAASITGFKFKNAPKALTEPRPPSARDRIASLRQFHAAMRNKTA